MSLLLLLHLIVAGIVVLVGRARLAAGLGIAVLLATAGGALSIGRSADRIEEWGWIPDLGLRLSLHLDGFAVLMVLVVCLLGALVLWYSLSYFEHDATYIRFVGLFVLFAGSMNGLVVSGDLFTMFLFWELTSVCSFLLIGLNDRSASARTAAVRALLVTGAGGLCLLAGVVLFQIAEGTTSFSELAERAPTGTMVTVAAMLVLVGAFTKSAQFPFHFWLPGAMAAPTPVSAYLHSATMVKAGIVVMARMAPTFGQLDAWKWSVIIAGGVTMVLGGVRALRQTDAKLLLAHSTVSQLGFLTVLVGLGVPGATYAGVAHLVAHAVFKAGAFLSVGIVDHSTGTRDVSVLSGLGRRLPVVAGLTALSAASMAGLIPLLGFATKEKVLAVLLDGDDLAERIALMVVIFGSVLSVAYSVRFMVGLFGRREGVEATEVPHAPGLGLLVPMAVIASTSLIGGLGAGTLGSWLAAPVKGLDAAAKGALKLWPGVDTALVISMVVLVVGAGVGRLVPIGTSPSAPRVSGERIFQWLFDGLLTGSKRVTAVSQSGSLLAYIGVVMAVVVVALSLSLLEDPAGIFDGLVWADSWVQAVVAALGVIFAIAVVRASRRFVGALLLGGVGFSCAVIFALFGAPDLALTQLLVETLTIVVFLLVLRQMPRRFDDTSAWAPRWSRLGISVLVGVTVALFAMMASGSRNAPSAGELYLERSLPEGGGRNVVNVVLVDFRGVDTLGEITVLGVAALGVVNLVRMARRRRTPAAGERAS